MTHFNWRSNLLILGEKNQQTKTNKKNPNKKTPTKPQKLTQKFLPTSLANWLSSFDLYWWHFHSKGHQHLNNFCPLQVLTAISVAGHVSELNQLIVPVLNVKAQKKIACAFMELSWLQEWRVIFLLARQTLCLWRNEWSVRMSPLSFPHLWEQSGQQIPVRYWLAPWAGRTSLHMAAPEAKHFCNVKIFSESLLCTLGSCLQLFNWHCVLLPVKTESQHVASSVYCCKVEALSIDSCSHLALDPSVHCFSFICSAASSLWSIFFSFYVPGVLFSLDSFCLCLFFTVSTSTTS